MVNCGAPGCENRSDDNKKIVEQGGKPISFHSLAARKEPYKAQWIHNLKRKIIPKHLNVCSAHFEPSCFERDLEYELLGKIPRNILKGDAVPTIFNHANDTSRKRISSIERQAKKAKRDIVNEAVKRFEESSHIEVGCTTNDLITTVDFGAQVNGPKPPKTASIRTQYREKHFQTEEEKTESENVDKNSFIVKLPKKEKLKNIAVNTEISFSPTENITRKDFIVENPLEQIEENELDTTSEAEDNLRDEDYVKSSSEDENESSDDDCDQSGDKIPSPDTKLIVYWSCLATLLQICHVCL